MSEWLTDWVTDTPGTRDATHLKNPKTKWFLRVSDSVKTFKEKEWNERAPPEKTHDLDGLRSDRGISQETRRPLWQTGRGELLGARHERCTNQHPWVWWDRAHNLVLPIRIEPFPQDASLCPVYHQDRLDKRQKNFRSKTEPRGDHRCRVHGRTGCSVGGVLTAV